MNTKMDRSKLLIGAYHFGVNAHTEKHVKDFKDSGCDFIIDAHGIDDVYKNRELLDLLEKYNIGVIADGIVPFWLGGLGEHAGEMSEIVPVSAYEKGLEAFCDHPAIWGIDCGDEPSALDFPHYNKLVSYVDKNFANQFAYLCLYPSYAQTAKNSDSDAKSQLGTLTYQEYIDNYCKYVPTDFISYDYYHSFDRPEKYYENQRIVADACRKTGRSFWMILQVNESSEGVYTSLEQLRYQAFSSLSFGAEIIIWACYDQGGWWYQNVLDQNGEKTQQYDKLTEINKEIKHIGNRYMDYRNVSTHFVGDFSDHLVDDMKQCAVKKLDTGVFLDIQEKDEKKLLVGQMASRNNDGSAAMLLFAADNPKGLKSSNYQVTFNCLYKEIEIVSSSDDIYIEAVDNGNYIISMKSNQAVLVIAK